VARDERRARLGRADAGDGWATRDGVIAEAAGIIGMRDG